ncbi:MAG: hypothetical protein K6E35_02170 [Bacteroidales bacterium]|nr:hypothetical protein [Bacteroidales bacterium]
MIALTHKELLLINGGSEETYQNGYNAGRKIKTAIVGAWDWLCGFLEGLS